MHLDAISLSLHVRALRCFYLHDMIIKAVIFSVAIEGVCYLALDFLNSLSYARR
jgi:hypothetical protein